MLEEVPFRSTWWVVGDRHADPVTLREQMGEVGLPCTIRRFGGATAISEKGDVFGSRGAMLAFCAPPGLDRFHGKFCGVSCVTDKNASEGGLDVVDAIGNGRADGVGGKVMVVDVDGPSIPCDPVVREVSDQLFLLGVDADAGHPARREVLTKCSDVLELVVSYFGGGCGHSREYFVVASE